MSTATDTLNTKPENRDTEEQPYQPPVESSLSPATDKDDSKDYSDENNLTLRALVTTKEAGVIIGKGGKNVAEMRELTGVKAGVSKVVQGVPDRVLTVSGTLDGVAQAYGYIAQTLLDNPITPMPVIQQHQQSSTTTTSTTTITTVRLLISHNLMGTVIGRQGAKIKHIQDTTGVRMVASKTLLSQSTERVVEVKGTVDAIHKAIAEIGRCLIEDKDRCYGTILYNPTKAVIVANQTAAAAAAGGAGAGTGSGHTGGAGLGTSIGTTALPHHLPSTNHTGNHHYAHPHGGLHYHSHHAPPSNNYLYSGNPSGTSVTAIQSLPPQALQQTPHIPVNHPMLPGSTGVGYFNNSSTNANNNSTTLLPNTSMSPQSYPPSYPSYPQPQHHINAFFTTATTPPTSSTNTSSNNRSSHIHTTMNSNNSTLIDIHDPNIRTQNISIPSDMVGCIIGKGGSKISEIRQLSGCRISIAKVPDNDTGERMFTIRGTADATERALYLLYGQLEAEKERRLKMVRQQHQPSQRDEGTIAAVDDGEEPAVEVEKGQQPNEEKIAPTLINLLE